MAYRESCSACRSPRVQFEGDKDAIQPAWVKGLAFQSATQCLSRNISTKCDPSLYLIDSGCDLSGLQEFLEFGDGEVGHSDGSDTIPNKLLHSLDGGDFHH